jgi:hypothetical protein
MKRLIIAAVAAALLAAPAAAIFIRAGEPVPLERLFSNVSEHVRRNPKDAQGHYTLGRLHSLAFVKSAASIHVISEPGKLPRFPPYESVKVQPGKDPRPAEALKHLTSSIRSYTTATTLEPKSSLFWMGLGWMLEQGAPYADRAATPWTPAGAKRPASEWLERSLAAYRKAYTLDYQKDLKAGHIGPGADTAISLEAGEGMLRILGKRKLNAAGRAEQARVKRTVAQLAALPRAVTPIIFPLSAPASLNELLSRGRSTRFDLAGDGRAERWPWVNDRAGILVWDPDRTGTITSGTQLFGTATWSMYWRDGYAALAALDDNRDGRLSGSELRGLAVWRDRDGDAVSGPGEVSPLSHYGITGIAAAPEGRGPEGPFHTRGIELHDGRRLPSYDWTPVSQPVLNRR